MCTLIAFSTALFLTHTHSHSGNPGILKTFEYIRQYLFWPGWNKWIVYLIEDCIECQTNETKRHGLHEAPLEQWGELEATPFKSIHIDHNGPLRPSSKSNTHYLLVVEAFSRFLGVYPVRDTGAQTSINAPEKWIKSYGIPQKTVHDNGSALINSDFINWSKDLGITLTPRTTYSPGTNGKVEVENHHLTRYWQKFMNQSGNNWSKLASKFAFAHNTSVSYTTGQTPYEIVFGTKPQVPMTLKLGLLQDKDKQCKSGFCDGFQAHTHSENSLPNKVLNHPLGPQLSDELMKRENEFKRIYSSTYQQCRQITSKAHEHRNRYKLGQPSVGQKVFLENHAQDVTKSQKLKQLQVGPFTVIKQITETTYEIREDANPNNIKFTHRKHVIHYFSKEERLPPLITNYVVISRDSDFYKHLVNSRIEHYNSGTEKHSFEVMPFVITPIRNNSDRQQKDDFEFSPRADSGVHSPASSMQQSPRSQKLSPYENRALFPLPELLSHTWPMTSMPR